MSDSTSRPYADGVKSACAHSIKSHTGVWIRWNGLEWNGMTGAPIL